MVDYTPQEMAKINQLMQQGLSPNEAVSVVKEGAPNPREHRRISQETYDPARAQTESLEKFQAEQEAKSPKVKSLEERYQELKEKGKKYISSTEKAALMVAGLESREPIKKTILDKLASELGKLEEKRAQRKISEAQARKEYAELQKRLKTAYVQGLEQRAYYKGYGGEVARAKQARLAAKERRSEETHQLKMKKAVGGLTIAKPTQRVARQPSVVSTRQPRDNPFGLTSQGISIPVRIQIERPSVRQPQRTTKKVVRTDPVNDKTSTNILFGRMNVSSPIVTKKKKAKSDDFLGLKSYF